jgi:hypothetical protein
MAAATRRLIETLDTRQLPHVQWWPVLQLMFPRFIEEVELGHHLQDIMASRRAAVVEVVPHRDAAGLVEPHRFDVYVLDEVSVTDRPGVLS